MEHFRKKVERKERRVLRFGCPGFAAELKHPYASLDPILISWCQHMLSMGEGLAFQPAKEKLQVVQKDKIPRPWDLAFC
jgi:hypothetical protein